MAADAETVPSPIDADVADFDHVLNAAARVGAEQLTLAALRVGNGTRALVMLLAARGASIGEVVNVLGLESGGLAAVLDVPAPKPLPDGERTTFFDDDADGGAAGPAGARRARARPLRGRSRGSVQRDCSAPRHQLCRNRRDPPRRRRPPPRSIVTRA